MSFFKFNNFIILVFSICCIGISQAQDTNQTTQDQGDTASNADAVAKKLANPNAVIGFFTFPIDFLTFGGELPGAVSQTGFKLSFQPSLPVPLGKATNIFVRPLVPLVFEQPVPTINGFENGGVALGDIGFDVALGHTWPSKWLTLIGVVGSIPAATNIAIGAGQWTLGPEAFVGKTTKWGFFGLLINQAWGLSSVPTKELSITGGQYFYTVNLGNAWQIQATPQYSINHEASSGNKWSVPIGTGVAKTVILGKMPLKFRLEYWYYAAAPDIFGVRNQIRLSVSPVINLPW